MLVEFEYSNSGKGYGEAVIESGGKKIPDSMRGDAYAVWTSKEYGECGWRDFERKHIGSRRPGAVPNSWLEVPTEVQMVSFNDLVVSRDGEQKAYYLLPGSPACEFWVEKDGLIRVVGEPVDKPRKLEVFTDDSGICDENFKKEMDKRRKINGVSNEEGLGLWSSWSMEGPNTTLEGIWKQLDRLKEIGVEYVIVDDTWQRPRNGYGDWRPNQEFKNLPWLFERIRDHGMKPGIWAALFMMSPDSETFKNYSKLGLKVKNTYPDLNGLVSGRNIIGMDICQEQTRDLAMENIQFLAGLLGKEGILKLDFWNVTRAGDLVSNDTTISEYTRDFILDARDWLKNNGHQGVKLFLCGQILDLADLSEISRGSKDPTDPKPKDRVLGQIRKLTVSKDTKFFEDLLTRLSANQLTKSWLQHAIGVPIEVMFEQLKASGELKGFYARMLLDHIEVIGQRHMWGTTVAEPLWKVSGVTKKDINIAMEKFNTAVANGLVRAVCFGDDMLNVSKSDRLQMKQMTVGLKQRYPADRITE